MRIPFVQIACALAGAMLLTAGPGRAQLSGSQCDGLNFDSFEFPPAVIDTFFAEYPAIAAQAGIEGTVTVKVKVAADGSFCSATVVSGIHPLLDRPARLAARECVFAPAMSGGTPVPGTVLIDYVFNATREHLRKEAEWAERLRWPAPLVSDVAQCISVERAGIWETGIYVYDGIVVEGDMSLAVLRDILHQVEEHAVGGEQPVSVYNYSAFFPRFRPNPDKCGDIAVNTCLESTESGKCAKTGVHRFRIGEQGAVYLSHEVWTE